MTNFSPKINFLCSLAVLFSEDPLPDLKAPLYPEQQDYNTILQILSFIAAKDH